MNAVMKDINSPTPRILDSLSITVLLFGPDLRLRYINPAGEMMFEASARHLLGLQYVELFSHEENLVPELQNSLQTGHPFTRYEVATTLLQHKDITIGLTVNPILDNSAETELLLEVQQLDRLLRISRD